MQRRVPFGEHAILTAGEAPCGGCLASALPSPGRPTRMAGILVVVEVEISFASPAADLEMSIAGVPTLEGLGGLNAQLVADPRFRPGLRILVDASEVDTSGISDDQVQLLSEPMVIRDWQYAPAAVAIIAPDERTYKHMRLYRAHLGGAKSKRQIFRSRAEALAWLRDLVHAPPPTP